ncbi:hypothetical protein JTE90_024719 [Oedothorax gibbosus]|nr:hypothetical protein JTE90_024719 [Oedothorax gibbosus]
MKDVFPLLKIQGCNFHYNQCLWKNVQRVGLVELYKSDPVIELHIKMCAVLAFLPEEDVEDGWWLILETTPVNPKLTQFYNYFVDQWLDNPNLDISVWNCHQTVHRTNNAVEGYHIKMNRRLKPHPSVRELVKFFRNEAIYADYLATRVERGLPGKKRKNLYVKLNTKITQIENEYLNTRNFKKCLTSITKMVRVD